MVSDAALLLPDKDARMAELEAALAAAQADISAHDILIDTLRVQIARLKRMTFGKSSEKLDLQIAQLELALEEPEAEAVVADARRAQSLFLHSAPDWCARCLPTYRAPSSGSSLRVVITPAPIVGARCGRWARTLTRCLMLSLSSCGSCARSVPSIAAGFARRSYKQQRRSKRSRAARQRSLHSPMSLSPSSIITTHCSTSPR